jgi:hypothetical protein
MVAGGFLVLVGLVLIAVRTADARAALVTALGVVVLLISGLLARGLSTSARSAYRLEVGPRELTVVWRDQVTRLPWTDLEYAEVTWNGPASADLEVRPRPDFRPVLPRNARPRPSRRKPGQLTVFSLSPLGPLMPECVGDVSQHIDLR